MEILILIAVLVGAVWGAAFLRQSGLLGGCLAVLVAAACFGLPMMKIELGPMPLTTDRMLIVALAAQYVVWRRLGWCDAKPIGKQEITLFALLAILIVSNFTSDWRVEGYRPVSRLILDYLMPAVMYWVARQTRQTPRSLLAVLGFFAVFGLYMALTTIAEYLQLWPLVFPRYIVTTVQGGVAEFIGRGRGPLLTPIANSVMLCIGMTAALCWWPRLGRVGQLALVAATLAFLAALYCTLTRSCWMSGLFTLAMVFGLTLPRGWRLPVLSVGAVVVLAIAVTQWEHVMVYKRDKAMEAQKSAESAELRPILARVAWNMFLDHPWFGCGYSHYYDEHTKYTFDRTTALPLEQARGYVSHNVLLTLLTETGLVGLTAFVTLLAFWTRDAWRLWRRTAAPLCARQIGLVMMIALGTYLLNGMFHDTSIMPLMNLTLFFLAGTVEGLRPDAAGRSPCDRTDGPCRTI